MVSDNTYLTAMIVFIIGFVLYLLWWEEIKEYFMKDWGNMP